MRIRLAVIVVFTLILGGLLAPGVLAEGPLSPVVTANLMADDGGGSGFVAGDVSVWNDADTLYVEFNVTATDWCLLETHLEVAETAGDVPQTKKGNPIPGKFTYSADHDCVTSYLYTMDLPAFDPVIAAHAALRGLDTETSTTVQSGPGGMIYGPLYAYAPPGDGAWGTSMAAVAPWEHPAWIANAGVASLQADGAAWMSTAEYVEDYTADSWRWVTDGFYLPGEPTSGHSLLATADNAEEFWLNGALLASNANWTIVTDYSGFVAPVPGWNTFDFVFKNWGTSTSPTANPTGLIYSMTVNYRPYLYESGWADGFDFDGKNWATYFTYDVWEATFTMSGEKVDSWVDLGWPAYDNACVEASIANERAGTVDAYLDSEKKLHLDMDFTNLDDAPHSVFIDIDGGDPSPWTLVGSFVASGGTGEFDYTSTAYGAGLYTIGVWVNGPSPCASILQTDMDITFTVD